MRHLRQFLALLLLAACWLLVMCSCATTTVRVVTTDKAGTVTVTETTTKASDAGALALAGQIATTYKDGFENREEKSTSDLGRILRGRPITRQEIANRWRPLNP
jgi:hypothetical protein